MSPAKLALSVPAFARRSRIWNWSFGIGQWLAHFIAQRVQVVAGLLASRVNVAGLLLQVGYQRLAGVIDGGLGA